MLRFAVLASGFGSNLQAIINGVRDGNLKATMALVISDNEDAFALKRAYSSGIPSAFVNPKDFKRREEFDQDMIHLLTQKGVQFVVLAGFMRILSPYFVRYYEGRILNIHPSLLPEFKGANAIKDAFEAGVKETGVTVHFVEEDVDAGPIIMQEKVPIEENDTLETLKDKIHKVEHELYPKVIDLFIRGKLKVKNRKVIIAK